MHVRPLIRIVPLAALIGLTAGCATTAQIDEIRTMAKNAQDTAAQAQKTATDAAQTADQAKKTADEAMTSAEEANKCCKTTNEKIDRMFKKSMSK